MVLTVIYVHKLLICLIQTKYETPDRRRIGVFNSITFQEYYIDFFCIMKVSNNKTQQLRKWQVTIYIMHSASNPKYKVRGARLS